MDEKMKDVKKGKETLKKKESNVSFRTENYNIWNEKKYSMGLRVECIGQNRTKN